MCLYEGVGESEGGRVSVSGFNTGTDPALQTEDPALSPHVTH